MKGKPGNPGLKGKLLDKSIEAYILALEIINQLSVKYRVETFSYLICNAWELLLKAQIIDSTANNKSIYYPKKRNEPRRSLSIRDCLKNVFTNENEPARRNLERVIDLRDESVHLVIAEIPKEIMGLFQANVLNYHKYLNSWFDISLSNRVPVGMMTIVYDFDPEDFELHILKKKMGRNEFEFLSRFQADINSEFDILGKPAEFSIDIGYKLGLIKKASDGDIILTQANKGTPTAIIQVPKDPSISHPYLRKGVIAKLKIKYPILATKTDGVLGYDIRNVVSMNNIKTRPEFYYKGKIEGALTQYSDSFIEWLFNELDKDVNYLDKTRLKLKTIKQ